MNQHIPYGKAGGMSCDFIVKYRFYTKEEGGRKRPPAQGYRSDFLYAEDAVNEKFQLWMIYPEFLDENNDVILDTTLPVPQTGKAQMWIFNKKFAEMHKRRIKIGQQGFFMEGSTKTAECEVIEIVGLKER
jgi:hypothetical protein